MDTGLEYSIYSISNLIVCTYAIYHKTVNREDLNEYACAVLK